MLLCLWEKLSNLPKERQFSSQYYCNTLCCNNINKNSLFVYNYIATTCMHAKKEQVNYTVWKITIQETQRR